MKIKVVYYSRTGQTKRFIEKISDRIPELGIYRIQTGGELCEHPYILITPTYNFGEIPEEVEKFLVSGNNMDNITSVISSGNKNWGDQFAASGNKVSEWQNVPLRHKYELRGNEEDVKKVVDIIRKENNKLIQKKDD